MSVEIKGIYLAEDEDSLSTGKRTEINLDDWALIMFVDLPTRYLTRAENGRILGIMDWTVQDSFSAVELSLSDKLHYVMEPMVDDGFEYYFLFELTDVQGSTVCSEPLALQLGAAPQEAEAAYTRLEWDEDFCAALEQEGIRFQFRYGIAAETLEPILAVTVSNETDEDVKIYLDAPSVDGTCVDRYGGYFSLEPGETKTKSFSDVDFLMNITGSAEPVRMLLSANKSSDYTTLFKNLPIELDGLPDAPPPLLILPFMDALAEEQQLGSEGGLDVFLLGMGYSMCWEDSDPLSEDGSLTLYFRVDNHTEEEHVIGFPALRVNGAELSFSGGYFRVTVHQQPGTSCYYKQTIRRRDICGMNPNHALPSMYSGITLIDSISSVDALMMVDGQGLWWPIELKEAGDGRTMEPEGPLLYEDEIWRVYRDELDDGDPEHVYLRIENLTDETWSFYFYAAETCVGSEMVGPHAWAFLGVKIPAELQEERSARLGFLRWEDDWRYYDTYARQRDVELTATESFSVVPAERGSEP